MPEQPPFQRYYSPYVAKQATSPLRRPKVKSKWSMKRRVVTSGLALLLVGFIRISN
jgi:hypothetical protein